MLAMRVKTESNFVAGFLIGSPTLMVTFLFTLGPAKCLQLLHFDISIYLI